ncbi:hypothetical protein ACFY7Y_33370 [Streptomyces virginiae]|uniref:hypothetical protein n=1 Tax=Streptomyces virginiae TaxID=1961 RepID=UPI0036A69BFD
MTRSSGSALAGPGLVDPPPTALVFPPARVRRGVEMEVLPRFADDRWQFAYLDQRETTRSSAIRWSTFPAPLRASFKRLAWALVHIPTPPALMDQRASVTRSVVTPATMILTVRSWQNFADWADRRSITRLDRVSREDLEHFATTLTDRKGAGADERVLFALTRAWAYAPFMLPGDRLVMPPWAEPASAPGDFTDSSNGPARGENRTPVIHPATMSPLLVWALRMVLDLAPDILAARREWQRLEAAVVPPGSAPRDGRDRLRAYMRQLRASGEGIPAYRGRSTRAVSARWDTSGPAANVRFIAGLLAVTTGQVQDFLRGGPEPLVGLKFADGAALPTPITAAVDGKAWTHSIDHSEVRALTVHLATAATVVIAYLSGMRPAEVLHLERGCATREERADGTVRYRVAGRHFKGVTDHEGNTRLEGEIRPDPWTVIEVVHRAIQVLENLSDEQLLLPRTISPHHRAAGYLARGLSSDTVTHWIKRFIAWANEQAAILERPHEIIPTDPDGDVTLRRFRRTVAWFIYRQPGGRIALGLQYGHVGASLAESYGGRTTADMLDVLDFEQGIAMADALAEASERIQAGETVSGPAADRYRAAAAQYHHAYDGAFVSKAQLTALRSNPRLQIHDTDASLLGCNYDAFKALCDPERGRPGAAAQKTPSPSRCNPSCGNVSRTDTHMERARREITRIERELADGFDPLPLRSRKLQRTAALRLIIDNHEAARPTEPA